MSGIPIAFIFGTFICRPSSIGLRVALSRRMGCGQLTVTQQHATAGVEDHGKHFGIVGNIHGIPGERRI